MNKKYLMAGMILSLMLIFAGSAVMTVKAQDDNTGLLTVSGTGTIALQPDIAVINIAVSTEKETVEEALGTNTTSVNNIKAALLELGIANEDIKTSNYSLYSSQKYYRDNTAGMDEYIFSVYYGFEIKLRDVSKMNEVLDAAIANGANSINNVTYDSSVRDTTYIQARDLAIDDANKNAAQIAEKLGVQVGEIASFKVRDYANDYASYSGMGMGGGGGSATLESGSLNISVTVDIAYQFETAAN